MKFNIETQRKFNNVTIDYGIIKGNNNILFIKAGLDGSMYGYENKYLKIAREVNKKYGSTVICSSNPSDGNNNSLEDAMIVIESFCKDNNYRDYEVYYMGYSNGGLLGAWYGTKYPRIKRLLLINAPLMFNYHKTKESLEHFDKKQVILIYGSEDQSYPYIGLLDRISNKKVNYYVIEDQDHHFSNAGYDFTKLPFDYLYNDKQSKN